MDYVQRREMLMAELRWVGGCTWELVVWSFQLCEYLDIFIMKFWAGNWAMGMKWCDEWACFKIIQPRWGRVADGTIKVRVGHCWSWEYGYIYPLLWGIYNKIFNILFAFFLFY